MMRWAKSKPRRSQSSEHEIAQRVHVILPALCAGRPAGLVGWSLRSPLFRVSVIKYEQTNEIMAKMMMNAATEYTLPVGWLCGNCGARPKETSATLS
jgi:hypothetical protein